MQTGFASLGYFISPTVYPADELAHPELHNAAAALAAGNLSEAGDDLDLAANRIEAQFARLIRILL